MGEKRGLEDAGDRAQRHKQTSGVRISLKKIGVWPLNRGCGCSGYHVHEVAQDFLTHTISAKRYVSVDIVKIPHHRLEEVRAFCKDLAQKDPYMPACDASEIEYVAISKTHFIHGCKLVSDGGRLLFNTGARIEWRRNDQEGAQILAYGPLCTIYGEALYDDVRAMHAVASADNLDAGVRMGEDELQAFGRVCDSMTTLMENAPKKQPYELQEDCLKEIELAGLGQFRKDAWKQLIRLRVSLPQDHCNVLKTVAHSLCASRVRVSTEDYELVSLLDPRAPGQLWPCCSTNTSTCSAGPKL